MRRFAVGVLTVSLAFGLAACSKDAEPQPTPEPTTQSPSPTPPPYTAPLTGAGSEDQEVETRPVVAVKIDNANQARPQVGLDAADIVFEEVVEGGATRFLALFQSQVPTSVGPVRSGRNVEAVLLPAYQPLLVISGAAKPTLNVLRAAGLKIREEGQPEDAFRREPKRRRPHNLFADVKRLAQVARDDKLPPATPAWAFGPLNRDADDTTAVRMVFSPTMAVRWDWNEKQAAWLRTQSGSAHTDAAGRQLAAENVVVLRVPVVAGGGVDVAGSATQEIEVIGSGEAVILRDGKSIMGMWRKSSPTANFEFVTTAGAVVPLAPGRTWVELLPTSSSVVVEHPTVATSSSPSPAR